MECQRNQQLKERVRKATERCKQLEQRLTLQEGKERARARKRDDLVRRRRTILIGTIIHANLDSLPPGLKKHVDALLEQHVHGKFDRILLGLSPREGSETDGWENER